MADCTVQGEDYHDIGSSDDSDLANQSWYWGSIDKDETNRILMAKEHGHFLVRDSTTSGEYTLVVRREEKVRNIRILHDERGGYGVVANRCDFGEVADLIIYLMNNPKFLHQHFARIDLKYPVSKPESMTGAKTYELLNKLVLRNKDLILHNERYVNHVKQRKLALQEIHQSKMTIASLKVVLSLFEEQLALQNIELSANLMKPSGAEASEDSVSLVFNKTTVEDRAQTLRKRIVVEEKKENELTSRALRKLDEIHQLKTVVSQVQQEVTFLRLRVEEGGLAREYLDLLLKEEKATDLSHYNPDNWTVQCDRQEAERMMADRVPGTFLVRPGSDGGHALSIVCAIEEKVETRHCLIYKDPKNFMYGFHPEYCIFTSLEELVKKHQTINLKYYNSRLDVCLTYPVNYRRWSGHGEPRF